MIAELRSLLNVEPSTDAFHRIVLHVRQIEASSDEGTFLVALDYASQHLESWHPRSRHFEVMGICVGPHGQEPLRCMRLARRLCFRRRMLKDKNLIRLVNDPGMSNLQSLNLWNNGITAVGVRTLAESPYMANLHMLLLGNNAIGDEGVIALANSPHMSNLRTLILTSCGITDIGAIALANSPHLNQLHTIAIDGNRFTDIGFNAMCEIGLFDGHRLASRSW